MIILSTLINFNVRAYNHKSQPADIHTNDEQWRWFTLSALFSHLFLKSGLNEMAVGFPRVCSSQWQIF